MPCQIINLEVETLRAIPGRFSRSDAVLLLGTKAVIDARVYERCLSGTGAVCTSIALPTLASLIDAEDWPAVADEIEACIPLGTPSTHVFLACTHYPLVLKYFQATLASRGLSDVPIISQERWLLESIESRLGGSFAAGAASSPMTVHLMRHSPPLIERLSNALSNIQIAPVPPQ
jgi:glutamate racemase